MERKGGAEQEAELEREVESRLQGPCGHSREAGLHLWAVLDHRGVF